MLYHELDNMQHLAHLHGGRGIQVELAFGVEVCLFLDLGSEEVEAEDAFHHQVDRFELVEEHPVMFIFELDGLSGHEFQVVVETV